LSVCRLELMVWVRSGDISRNTLGNGNSLFWLNGW